MTAAEQLQDVLAHADDPRPPTADEPIRFSRLKLFGKSPAHFVGQPPPDSSAIDVGAAAHSMILGGRRIVAYTAGRRYGKEFDKFAADNADALILTSGEYRRAERMAAAVMSHADAMRVLDGVREQTMTWNVQGRACRGTPDVRGETFITELKTGETSDPNYFPFKMRRFCYHGQLAWYSDGAVLAGHPDPRDHYIVAVEAAPPHVVTVFNVSDWIDLGRRIVRLWFERLRQCEAANEWPGYSQAIVRLPPLDDFAAADGELPAIEDAG